MAKDPAEGKQVSETLANHRCLLESWMSLKFPGYSEANMGGTLGFLTLSRSCRVNGQSRRTRDLRTPCQGKKSQGGWWM